MAEEKHAHVRDIPCEREVKAIKVGHGTSTHIAFLSLLIDVSPHSHRNNQQTEPTYALSLAAACASR